MVHSRMHDTRNWHSRVHDTRGVLDDLDWIWSWSCVMDNSGMCVRYCSNRCHCSGGGCMMRYNSSMLKVCHGVCLDLECLFLLIVHMAHVFGADLLYLLMVLHL